MTISQVLARVDSLCPNQRSITEKLAWLSALDGQVKQFLDKYEGADGETFTPYTEEDMGRELMVRFPYDELYVHYLHAQIMYTMGEISKYENALLQYNNMMQSFRMDYNQTHMPKQVRWRWK